MNVRAIITKSPDTATHLLRRVRCTIGPACNAAPLHNRGACSLFNAASRRAGRIRPRGGANLLAMATTARCNALGSCGLEVYVVLVDAHRAHSLARACVLRFFSDRHVHQVRRPFQVMCGSSMAHATPHHDNVPCVQLDVLATDVEESA